MGAGGRDFHDFNVVFRNDPDVDVVAFTATQVPGHRRAALPALARRASLSRGHPGLSRGAAAGGDPGARSRHGFLAYSDLSHEDVMHKGVDRPRRRTSTERSHG
jgi:predicted GTPase